MRSETTHEELVPDAVIPHQTLPPLRYRDLPEAPRWTSLVGPSVILAGLALGSGEFVFWPYITYRTGFIFFWRACWECSRSFSSIWKSSGGLWQRGNAPSPVSRV